MIGSKEGAGYARHAKGLAKGLRELGHEVEWGVGPRKEAHVLVVPPLSWPVFRRHENTLGCAVWEGSRAPYAYVHPLQYARMLVSPSLHSARAFHKTLKEDFGRDRKITVIPHGYDPSVFVPGEKTEEPVILFVGGWSKGFDDRRKLHIALRAYDLIDDPDVKFVIKDSPYPFPEHLIKRMNLKNKNILVNKQYLSDEQMARLYQSASVLVEPTGAEGFCLPILEAYACGVVPVTNVFGGQEELMKKLGMGKYLVRKGEKYPAVDGWGEGNVWFEPSVEEYAVKMMKALKDSSGFKPSYGVLEGFSWKNIAKEYAKILEGGDGGLEG